MFRHKYCSYQITSIFKRLNFYNPKIDCGFKKIFELMSVEKSPYPKCLFYETSQGNLTASGSFIRSAIRWYLAANVHKYSCAWAA